MNCQGNNISTDTGGLLKNIPGFRYMKEPLDSVSQLYEKYPDGVERGTFVFVLEKNLFYTFRNGRWDPIAVEADIYDAIVELINANAGDGTLQAAIEAEAEARQEAIEEAIEAVQPIVILEESAYDALPEKDPETIYFLL
jgi:hypothetical protein